MKLALLEGITSKHKGDVICLSYLHSFSARSKLQSHKNVCENKDFCSVTMPSKDAKILMLIKH